MGAFLLLLAIYFLKTKTTTKTQGQFTIGIKRGILVVMETRNKKQNKRKKRVVKPLPSIPENVIKRNLDMIKSVLDLSEIKLAIQEIRKEFKIPELGIIEKTDAKKLWHNIDFLNAAEELFNKTNLPYHFITDFINYLIINVIKAPILNYGIAIEERGKWAKWIGLRTYMRLTKKEMERAVQELLFMQRMYFKKEWSGEYRPKRIDRDKQLQLKTEMEQRVLEDKYLKSIKSQYGKKEYEKARKVNKSVRYTSRDVAKKILGSGSKKRAATVRQRCSRFKKQ